MGDIHAQGVKKPAFTLLIWVFSFEERNHILFLKISVVKCFLLLVCASVCLRIHTLCAYDLVLPLQGLPVKAVFIELPPFSRYRDEYFSDESYRAFQLELMQFPEKGDVIQGTGGLRKIRVADKGRGKGKRGGSRVIYYWFSGRSHFLLFTVYGKDVQDDLSGEQRKQLSSMLQSIKEKSQ